MEPLRPIILIELLAGFCGSSGCDKGCVVSASFIDPLRAIFSDLEVKFAGNPLELALKDVFISSSRDL